MSKVTEATGEQLHQPRRHAAARTEEYIFAQLIPYIGNKRKLLHLIGQAVEFTGCEGGTFVDLFAGSTVVARWAKKAGFRVIANDWEPYSHEIALGTVVPNRRPAFRALGGAAEVFAHLNSLPPVCGYVARHLCPRDDDKPDPAAERMFFTRANGERIDAIREQLAAWRATGAISRAELAYVLASLIYAVSYASNTSGVFKGYHNGWGGRTGTALYRIRGRLAVTPPVLHDNGQANLALQADAQQLAPALTDVAGGEPAIVYIDPPYNQHPYGSNYHVLNTVTLWDSPPLSPGIMVDGRAKDKAAIRKDWRTARRSPYNSRTGATAAFDELIGNLRARWALVSYSTDGNIPLEDMLTILARRGELHVFMQTYKRYRVSTPRMSHKSHNVEFVAAIDLAGKPSTGRVGQIVAEIRRKEDRALRG